MTRLVARSCLVCGAGLTGRKQRFCGRLCCNRYHRNPKKDHARHRRWYLTNTSRAKERVVVWKRLNPGAAALYNWRWRHSSNCAFCGSAKYPWAAACRKCTHAFGCLCTKNPDCGVRGKHKHCPCWNPIQPEQTSYAIEACPECKAEMERLQCTLSELFTRSYAEDKPSPGELRCCCGAPKSRRKDFCGDHFKDAFTAAA